MTDLLAAPSLGVIELAGLLAGLGSRRPVEVLGAHAGMDRTCVDGGSGAVFAVRAPGPRALDVQVQHGDGRWTGLHLQQGVPAARTVRRLWPGREGGPVHDDDPSAPLLRDIARVWSVEYDETGRPVASSWQVHRHHRIGAVLARLGRAGGWAAAAAEFDALHGFAVSTTTGPWSIGRRFADPDRVRLGTSRWAWSADDRAKRARLAEWIGRHGGDAAYATALHHLLSQSGPAGGHARIGRAAEIDLDGDHVVGVSAYLVAPTTTVHEGTTS